GVWFLLCSLVSTSGLLLVGLAFITAPFLGVARWRDYGARLTNLAVLFFPVISVFAAVSLLQGVFFRDPFALFAPAFQYDEARWRVLRDMFVAPNGWAMILITIAGILACFAIGRRRTALLPLLVVIVIMYGKVFGIVPQNDVGYSMLALIMVIVALWYRLPSQKDLPRAIFIFAALTAAIFWGSIIIAAPGTSVLGSLLAGTR
ncbi:MAG: hypothetical protein LBB58_07050, partial [Cellulomonadaceae bacterium]|nr:hypothetical protein [Cellulomonadaceae bacterium]